MLSATVGVVIMALAASYLFAQHMRLQSYEDKRSSIKQIKQATQALVESQNDLLADRLAQQIEVRTTKRSIKSQNEFLAIGLLSYAEERKIQSPSLKLEWVENFSSVLNDQWLRSVLLFSQKEMLFTREDGGVTWTQIMGPDQQPYFLMTVLLQVKSSLSEKNQIAIGVLPLSIFSSVNLIAKGEEDILFVTDIQGNTFSYPDQRYVGTKISSHPVVTALAKGESVEKFIETSGNPIVGGYQPIRKSNLYVVMTAQVKSPFNMMLLILTQIVFVALAIAIVTALVVGYYVRLEKNQTNILEKNFRLLMHAEGVGGDEKNSEEIFLRNQKEQWSKEFARGVVKSLRNPITTIMGLAHVVGSARNEKSQKEATAKIVKASRDARDFIESLATASGCGEETSQAIELMPAIDQVVSTYRNDLVRAKIQLEENYANADVLRGHFDDLKDSLKAILGFAIRQLSTRDSDEKRIKLLHRRLGGNAEITIEVHGVELKPEIRRCLFLPFQLRGQFADSMNFDMALARTYFLNLNGDVSVENLGYEGFRFVVRVPVIHQTGYVSQEISI